MEHLHMKTRTQQIEALQKEWTQLKEALDRMVATYATWPRIGAIQRQFH